MAGCGREFSADQALAELTAIQSQLASHYQADVGWTVDVLPLQQALAADARPGLLLLEGAILVVLLTVCVNVAGLVLVRASGRSREIATRRALGATPGRVMRQLILDSAVLGAAGGLLGAGVGTLMLQGCC